MNKKILYTIPIVAIIIYFIMKNSSSKKLVPIVASQKIRGTDSFGSGAFGAKRSNHIHQGIDIVTKVGENILSPISGVVTRFPSPYGDDLRWSGIEIKNETFSVKIFYVSTVVSANTVVKSGQKIAVSQNINSKYGGDMTNHAHLEVRDTKTNKIIDPTNLF
jgi:murein DD-endopeptidase MepM/ murein hydrolase activator NlpD